MVEANTEQRFQRAAPSADYAADYLASLPPMTPRSLNNVRCALKWYTDCSPTVILDGKLLLQWLNGRELSPTSKQAIWDRAWALYRWIGENYTNAQDLPDLQPVQFGRRKAGETRGRKRA
jgi:hypothetical protein